MMKAIPYVLLLPLVLIVLFVQCEKEPEPVNIPDDAFLNALIEEGVDTDGDGQISHSEAEAVRSLDVSGYNISDMTGIEKFVSLDILLCSVNQLTSLDVSNITALSFLDCSFNRLTSLDVSYIPSLKYLACVANQLTKLNVSNNTALEFLYCSSIDCAPNDNEQGNKYNRIYCKFFSYTLHVIFEGNCS